jgi:hypothetical protein
MKKYFKDNTYQFYKSLSMLNLRYELLLAIDVNKRTSIFYIILDY